MVSCSKAEAQWGKGAGEEQCLAYGGQEAEYGNRAGEGLDIDP